MAISLLVGDGNRFGFQSKTSKILIFMNIKYLTAFLTIASVLSVGIAVGNVATAGLTELNFSDEEREAIAQKPPIYTDNEIAIDGTDSVAYFREAKPVAGNNRFSYEWNQATWYFSTSQNRDMFAENPEKYAPQYGGYCAYAVSKGETAPTDPNAWTIVDGKLYLNFSKEVQKLWSQDIPGNIAKADRNWPAVLNK